QLVRAVAGMHEHHVVHLDIKPENIMVDARGHVTLVDFGSARYVASEDLILPLDFTHQYLAPEGVYWTNALDVWAIGVVTYSLLALR
ncbi:kinase-like domain-containing protein, partial [Piptocephalis cylindrospora]